MSQLNILTICQPVENKKTLQQNLTQMRNKIQSFSSNQQLSESFIMDMVENIKSIINRIDQYRRDSIQSVQNIRKNKAAQSIIKFDAQNKTVPEKTTMYIWQILNFICINLQQFPNDLVQLISPLLIFDLKYQQIQSVNSLKNGLIFYHNLLTKLLKDKKQFQQNESLLINLFGYIIVAHFQITKQMSNNDSLLFSTSKSQATIVAQMQWIGYIFMQFFNQIIYSSKGQSFIRKVVEQSNNSRIAYYVLHMIGNYFQEMVDKRITTELISGFQCSIEDVKQMYNMKKVCLVQLKISQFELKYVFVIFKENILHYRNIVRQYLSLRVQQTYQNQDLAKVQQEWLRKTQIITQIFHILNNVVFIGGYNKKLQDLVIQTLLQQDTLLISYLQISYLLYKNIQSTRYNSKVQLLVQIQKEIKKQLFESVALEINTQQLEKTDIKLLQLQKILAPGQLVSVLRLLTNLVHINHRSQIPFQKQPKYLHMILSMTHESVSQATMKQWAIMFIRNVSEWSPILREQISKINMQMKVS